MAVSSAFVTCKVSASLAFRAKLGPLQSTRPSFLSSAFGLKPTGSRVSCTLEKSVTSVVDGAKATALAQSLRTRDVVEDYTLPTQRLGSLVSEGDALNSMISFMSMARAQSTLEDFCRSYFMFHNMDVENPVHVFLHLPVLLFFESAVYQLDEQNEEHLYLSPMMGGLGRDPFAGTREVLREQDLLTKRIEDKLRDGVEYWRLEQSLCAALSNKEMIKVEDVLHAQRIRSFDYRVLDLLLYGLRKKPVNEAYYDFLTTAELLVEIVDDLEDYEKDVRKNSFNMVRFYSYIFGPRDAPTMLAEFISNTEKKYQHLLNQLEPDIVAKYRKRCEEAVIGGNCRAVPVLGEWRMPSLITDEEAFRKDILS